MTNKIAIITDSTCDIPADWITEFDIDVIPLIVVWENQQYLDGVDLTAEEFYARLESDVNHPTTSQPAPLVFLKAYKRVAEKGYQEVFVLTISSAMSGTYQSAVTAAEKSPIPVQVYDSKSNSMGLGWQVIAAARKRDSGGNLADMRLAAERTRDQLAYYITLDTMDYLLQGGRIGGAVKYINSVLKVKPLILVNHSSGTVGASIPARSRSGAIDGLYKQFFKHIDVNYPLHITVLHNAALQEAQALAERVKQEFNPKEMFISIVSPILGVHTGPRALALCGYAEEPLE